MDVRDQERPKFNKEQVYELTKSLYGLSGIFEELPSERDQNFHLVTVTGEEFVLKISAVSEKVETLEFQNQAMHHLADGFMLPIAPRIQKTVSGDEIAQIESHDGNSHFVRLVSYLHGRIMSSVNPHSSELLEDFGKFIGTLSKSFADFDHPSTHRDFYWDLKKASLTISKFKENISDPEKLKLVEYYLSLFETNVVPRMDELRTSVIHNDANDDNIVINNPHDENRTFGILDFGDMVYSHTINELAIAIAYAILDKADPIGVGQKIVSGYHSVYPLTELELEVLFPLVCTRLATSVSVSAYQKTLEPDNEYLVISEGRAWKMLSQLSGIHPRYAAYCFLETVGLEPCIASLQVKKWLKKNSASFSSPFGIPLDATNSVVLDLSVGSMDVSSPLQLADNIRFGNLVAEKLQSSGVNIGIGRYNEPRLIYSGTQYLSPGDENRTIHLALDLFVEGGTPVLSVYDGVIHSFKDNAKPLDNGPTIIVKHKTSSEGPPFYILYSHLSRDSLNGLS
ncbi:MAG: phosphotransferase, partial [Candidatus Thorarchaeota archaeon]